nr:unnamed protein product [Callosobruchus chinensis]
MMPWQGNSDTLIDRFDGRAHLDYIPPVKKEEETELSQEERQLNYERYRIIAQNSFLGITEEKFLKQLQLEEQFGYTELHQKGKKEPKSGGAAIGFNYDEGTAIAQVPEQPDSDPNTLGDSDSDADCSDLDVDLSVNVSKMDAAQAHEMNKHGRQFGMHSNDFYSFLTDDMEEAENRRMAREEEQEKALYAGRKSRRERRYHREKRLANRVLSPPSYAARESPTLASSLRESKSASRSPSPENTGKITFITSFGGEDDAPSSSKPTAASYADKLKQSVVKGRRRSAERTVFRHRSRSDSRRRKSRSGSRLRSRRSRSRSVSRGNRTRRSRSPLRRRSRSVSSRSRSRSISVVKSKSRSRSYSRDRKLHSKPSFRGVGNTARNYKRQRRGSSDSSSSSSSSSRGKSPVKRKSYSASPTKETFNKSRQQDQEDTKMEVDEPPKVLPRYYGRKRSDESSSDIEEEHVEEDQDNGEQKAQS